MKQAIVLIILSVFAIAAVASPAAWYKWRSVEDGTIVCSQVPLGDGCARYDGPYKDLQCRTPGKP